MVESWKQHILDFLLTGTNFAPTLVSQFITCNESYNNLKAFILYVAKGSLIFLLAQYKSMLNTEQIR